MNAEDLWEIQAEFVGSSVTKDIQILLVPESRKTSKCHRSSAMPMPNTSASKSNAQHIGPVRPSIRQRPRSDRDPPDQHSGPHESRTHGASCDDQHSGPKTEVIHEVDRCRYPCEPKMQVPLWGKRQNETAWGLWSK
jgi:hypothetical protein